MKTRSKNKASLGRKPILALNIGQVEQNIIQVSDEGQSKVPACKQGLPVCKQPLRATSDIYGFFPIVRECIFLKSVISVLQKPTGTWKDKGHCLQLPNASK